jgi:hypothetical protein
MMLIAPGNASNFVLAAAPVKRDPKFNQRVKLLPAHQNFAPLPFISSFISITELITETRCCDINSGTMQNIYYTLYKINK